MPYIKEGKAHLTGPTCVIRPRNRDQSEGPFPLLTLRTYVTLAAAFGDHLLDLRQEHAAKRISSKTRK
jgi:hypothetical protein